MSANCFASGKIDPTRTPRILLSFEDASGSLRTKRETSATAVFVASALSDVTNARGRTVVAMCRVKVGVVGWPAQAAGGICLQDSCRALICLGPLSEKC